MSNDFYMDERVSASYDEEFTGLDGDLEFYLNLALEAKAQGLAVLELACGTGRVTIPIAQAGVNVVGLDRSAAMLAVARRKSQDISNVRWIEADMADFALDGRFGLAIIPYRSFLHLTTVAAQKSCLASINQHLVPGGRLALNFWNPDLVRMGERLKGGSETQVFPQGGGSSVRKRRSGTVSYSTAEQQLDEVRLDEELDESGVVVSRVYRGMKLRYVFRYEMEHLLALSGFEVEALYGWFDGRPFDDASSEMVWLARKRYV